MTIITKKTWLNVFLLQIYKKKICKYHEKKEFKRLS